MLRNLVSNPKRTLMHSHCSLPFIDSFEWNLPLGVGILVGHSIVLTVDRRIRDRINGKFAESQSDPNYIQIFDWSVRRCCCRHCSEISFENVWPDWVPVHKRSQLFHFNICFGAANESTALLNTPSKCTFESQIHHEIDVVRVTSRSSTHFRFCINYQTEFSNVFFHRFEYRHTHTVRLQTIQSKADKKRKCLLRTNELMIWMKSHVSTREHV